MFTVTVDYVYNEVLQTDKFEANQYSKSENGIGFSSGDIVDRFYHWEIVRRYEVTSVKPDYTTMVLRMQNSGASKIDAIKEVRARFNMGLKEAKEIVDRHWRPDAH